MSGVLLYPLCGLLVPGVQSDPGTTPANSCRRGRRQLEKAIPRHQILLNFELRTPPVLTCMAGAGRQGVDIWGLRVWGLEFTGDSRS